jgi:hypothetical protein
MNSPLEPRVVQHVVERFENVAGTPIAVSPPPREMKVVL